MPHIIYQKERLLCNTIKNITDRGQGAIIYVEYYDTLDKLLEVLSKNKDKLNIKNIYEISGRVPLAQRHDVEQYHGPRDIILVSQAGSESINLQKVNNLLFYNIPFGVENLIQAIGRITRITTTYDEQNVYFIEVRDTIDTYKRILIQDHADTIRLLLGDSSTLPPPSPPLNKSAMNRIKHKYLWRTGK